MSLAIDVDEVEAVLLADGWHVVIDDTFDLDAYEFKRDTSLVHGGGSNGVCATGFVFEDDDGQFMAGPLTAILAVRWKRDD